MNLLRCATHTVVDLPATTLRYEQWLDYKVVEEGEVAADLAAAWGTPASAGRRYAVMQPRSGADVFLRFVEGDPVPDYLPIRSYGWAAIEICVEDVLAVNARMTQPGSPFAVIGQPTRIAGIDTIYPMQVRGPDQETLYFTEITTQETNSGLPTAESPIDKVFILVLASPDIQFTMDWFVTTLGFQVGDRIAIRYSMISQAFGLPSSDLHEIATAKWDTDVFLEFDQYPETTTVRAKHEDALHPGVSICTLVHPAFDKIDVEWLAEPVVRHGALYGGRRVGTLKTPEGALLELVAG